MADIRAILACANPICHETRKIKVHRLVCKDILPFKCSFVEKARYPLKAGFIVHALKSGFHCSNKAARPETRSTGDLVF